MKSVGHRTVSGRRPAGVCTHRTGTGRFLFKLYIVLFLTIARNYRKSLNDDLTMPVRAPADVLRVELPPRRSDVFLQKNILYLHRYFISKPTIIQNINISIKQLRMINMQRTSDIDIFLQSWASVVFITIIVRVRLNLLYFYILFLCRNNGEFSYKCNHYCT